MKNNKEKSSRGYSKGDLNILLSKIVKNQEKILGIEKKLLEKENKVEDEESAILKEERLELKEENEDFKENLKEENLIEDLEKLDERILKNINSKVRKITKKDVFKGFIGAFVGVVSHFSFMEAFHIAPHLDILQSTFLYVLSFLIIVIMLYYTGFKDVKKKLLFNLFPLRATLLFVISIVTIIFVYFIFGNLETPITFINLYDSVAPSMILATIGAGTADLIGRNKE